jgi:aspartyl-tRNA(Asn)/glutamyl-tRNA(Gln) amidotransferase subunit A
MDAIGPISRTVQDCAMTLGAIAGRDPKDPFTWDVPVPDYRQALDGNIQGVKIGVIKERAESPLMDPEFRQAASSAVAVLGELGASVEDVSLPLTQHAGAISMGVLFPEWASLHRQAFQPHFDQLDHNNKIRFLTGEVIPAQAYYKAQKLRALMRQQILEALQAVDVLVLPSGPVTARPVETVPGIQSKEQMAAGLAGRISFTGPFNLAGVPALSLPCGFSSENLPMGLQIVGRPFAEDMVMKVAHAYERNTDWHTRRPPI